MIFYFFKFYKHWNIGTMEQTIEIIE